MTAHAARDGLACFPQQDVTDDATRAPTITPPASAALKHREDEEEKDEADPDQSADGEAAVTLALFARRLRDRCRLFGRKLQLGQNLVRAPFDPAGIVAMAEIGLHPLDIFESEPVGDRPLEPVADLDPHLALVRGDDQNDPVIALGIAQRPFAAQAIAVIGDIVALQTWDRHDHELPLVGFLELIELLRQPRLGRLVDDVRCVDHRRGAALREGLRRGGQGEPRPRRDREYQMTESAHGRAAQLSVLLVALSERMSSVGATSAPSLTAS